MAEDLQYAVYFWDRFVSKEIVGREVGTCKGDPNPSASPSVRVPKKISRAFLI